VLFIFMISAIRIARRRGADQTFYGAFPKREPTPSEVVQRTPFRIYFEWTRTAECFRSEEFRRSVFSSRENSSDEAPYPR